MSIAKRYKAIPIASHQQPLHVMQAAQIGNVQQTACIARESHRKFVNLAGKTSQVRIS
jgi:hypothetical protein